MNLIDKIKRLRELDKKATPAPWPVDYGIIPCGPASSVESHHGRICGMYAAGLVNQYDPAMTTANAEFIGEARTAIPVLCNVLEEAIVLLKSVSTGLKIHRPVGTTDHGEVVIQDELLATPETYKIQEALREWGLGK